MKSVVLSFFVLFSFLVDAQKFSKVKIFTGSEGLSFLAQQGLSVDHGMYKKDVFFITDLSEQEISQLILHGFNFEIMIDDVKKFYVNRNKVHTGSAKNENCISDESSPAFIPVPSNFDLDMTYAGFYRYSDMLSELDAMAAQYPNLITVKSPISNFTTHEGRPIYHVKISDNPNIEEAEKEVLYTAIHHAREPLSMSQTIFYMWYLLENYSTNEEVKFLVNNTEMYFVPCINPDGYIYNETTDPSGGGMHRKNRNPAIGTSNVGVDLNRNYSYGWNTTGVSPNQNSDVYPGTAAFSEPETQAMKWLQENHTFLSALNAHSYGNLLLYPIGSTTNELADHNDYFIDLCGHMAEGNNLLAQKSSALYPASGDSDDYAYKMDIGVGQKDTVFSFTPEVGTDFWPAASEIIPTSQNMVLPNLMIAHLTHKYLSVTENDPSSISNLSGNFQHAVQRLGLEDGIVTISISPILNILSVGAPIPYNLGLRSSATGAISYNLNPSIQFGDEIKYVLETNYGDWVHRDTITKTFGIIETQFSDDASNTVNWTGNWNTTTLEYYSPTKSFTDSPGGNYQNNSTKNYTFSQDVDLSIATSAMVSFYAKWNIEADYDYCQFQVSNDAGLTWIGQCGRFTVPGTSASGGVQPEGKPLWEGNQSSWVQEEIDLSDYLGQTVKVRFQLKTDGGATEDGFYFDDFKVMYNLQDTSTSVSISELNQKSIQIYPNPTRDKFEASGLEVGTEITIIDVNGKVIFSQTVTKEKESIELKSPFPGTYIFSTSKSNQLIKIPFVVVK